MPKFSIPLDKLAKKVQVELETVARKATLQMFESVIKLSPVATGRFRANWNVSYGIVVRTVTESTDLSRAEAEVQKVLTLPIGGVIFMANSLPYSQRLENGWSKQAPTGMVRLSALQYQRYVRQAIR